MKRIKKILPIAIILYFSSIINGQDSLSINNLSVNASLNQMKSYQGLYISGAALTYSSVLLNLSSVAMEDVSEILFLSSISLGVTSPILIHLGHGRARNKAGDLVDALPSGHKLKDKYNKSRIFYFAGFAPMAGAIAFSTLAMPASLLNDDPAIGGAVYCLAFASLFARDVLWGKAMKGYVEIASEVEKEDKGLEISFSPQYNIENRSGGLALNLHF